MRMKTYLRYFVRLDAGSNLVAGTGVYRKSMPKTGKWREITPVNGCCFPYTALTYDIPDVTLTGVRLTVLCGATAKIIADTAVTTTDINSTVEALNSAFSYLGSFQELNGDVVFHLKQEIADEICTVGALTFTVTQTP